MRPRPGGWHASLPATLTVAPAALSDDQPRACGTQPAQSFSATHQIFGLNIRIFGPPIRMLTPLKAIQTQLGTRLKRCCEIGCEETNLGDALLLVLDARTLPLQLLGSHKPLDLRGLGVCLAVLALLHLSGATKGSGQIHAERIPGARHHRRKARVVVCPHVVRK